MRDILVSDLRLVKRKTSWKIKLLDNNKQVVNKQQLSNWHSLFFLASKFEMMLTPKLDSCRANNFRILYGVNIAIMMITTIFGC